jgi:phosphoribosylformylglycinamidine synthase
LEGDTITGTVMAHGFNPYLSEKSPFHGAVFAIVEAVAKAVAAGARYEDCYLTLQEFFPRPGDNPERWGLPLAALLGAYYAQKKLKIGAIGGKDSMSGTFKDMDVPPTLVAFAVSPLKVDHAVSNEFKSPNSNVYLIKAVKDENGLPNFNELCENFKAVNRIIQEGKVKSAHTVRSGGICEAVSKMCFGNMIGASIRADGLFDADFGSVIIETEHHINYKNAYLIGKTCEEKCITVGNEKIELRYALLAWQKPLFSVFPEKVEDTKAEVLNITSDKMRVLFAKESFAKPKVFIPVFPGTNCEYDSERAFAHAGAQVETLVFKNLTQGDINKSIDEMKRIIDSSQIVMIPGGFSGGDEPDGSGKFIATAFRNPKIKESIMNLLYKRDGLMLGICNGFQALIKLGLVPFGEIRDMDSTCPTLTFNKIGRHMSSIVNTRICSKLSPWLGEVSVGDIHAVAISHGEGRFVASDKMIKTLIENGQVATQYVDLGGNATMDMPYNPNGSFYAIEGITSPDGRVFGKMAHSERIGKNVYKNIPGDKDQKIFISGVKYFK